MSILFDWRCSFQVVTANVVATPDFIGVQSVHVQEEGILYVSLGIFQDRYFHRPATLRAVLIGTLKL